MISCKSKGKKGDRKTIHKTFYWVLMGATASHALKSFAKLPIRFQSAKYFKNCLELQALCHAESRLPSRICRRA